MAITTRQELIDYCLRSIGAPVLDIAIADEQIDDKIDDALLFYADFHADGYEKTYYKHKVTGNLLTVTGLVDDFLSAEIITGQTSGTTAKVIKPNTTNSMWVDTPTGSFINGETIKGSISGFTDVISSYVTGDKDKGYITLPDSIQSVTKLFPADMSSNVNSLFSTRFQLRLADIYSLQTAALAQYEQTMTKLSTLDMLMVGEQPFQFNRRTSKLTIMQDWRNHVEIGQYMLMEVYQWVDPESFKKIYDDRSLKKLATAYIKKAWATNLKLYSGVQLPGGITIDGRELYADAIREVAEAEQEMRDTYELPPSMMVG